MLAPARQVKMDDLVPRVLIKNSTAARHSVRRSPVPFQSAVMLF
jgi:hypothetical protein